MSTNPKIFIKRLIEKLNDKDLIIEQQKSFIQQQEKMLELLIEMHIEKFWCANSLGLPAFAYCPPDDTEGNCNECLRKYLQGEVSK